MKKHQNASGERVQETKDGREMKANGGGGCGVCHSRLSN